MSGFGELNAERLRDAIGSPAESPVPNPALPAVQAEVDDVVAGGTLLATILKIVPSYLLSFLGHVALIVGLSVAASISLQGERISLDGGVAVAEPAARLESLEVALDLKAPLTEMDELQREESRESDLIRELPLAGPDASKPLFEGLTDGDSEEFAEAAAAWGEMATPSEALDQTRGDASFFGVHASGRRFVFIIDCSGSMEGLRWNLAKAELKNSVRNLDEEKEFLVLLYNHDTWAMFNQSLAEADLVKATPDNQRRFFQWLSRQNPRGWTRPRVALELALRRDPDAVFLLSDGELQDDSQQFLLAANQPWEREDGSRRQTPVHTVALDLSLGAGLLEQIAGQNSGVFTHITTGRPPRR